jgi:signal transduction histidine kinase
MKKRALYWIIALLCVSLTGIISVQYLWIRNAFKVREAQFNQRVNDAMATAVNALETKENAHYLVQRMKHDSLNSEIRIAVEDSEEDIPVPQHKEKKVIVTSFNMDTSFAQMDFSLEWNSGGVFSNTDTVINIFGQGSQIEFPPELEAMMLEDERLRSQIEFDSVSRLYDSSAMVTFPEFYQYQYQQPLNPDVHFFTVDPQTGQIFKFDIPPPPPVQIPRVIVHHKTTQPGAHTAAKSQKLKQKVKKMQDVMQKMALEMERKPRPVEERINADTLRNALKKALNDHDITLPFEFAVLSQKNAINPVPIRSAGFAPSELNTPHRVSLFPNDIFEKGNLLLVFFPGQTSHMLKSLSVLAAGSIFFTLIILLTSILSIIVMLRQKKVSDIKTDFINNMTHEFKTPIATISIAVDSINNPKVIDEPDQIKAFTRIIREENNRMNSRVEQVLQMALLDSRDFKLKPETTDMHVLLTRAVEHYRLQVEKRGGQLNTSFEATRSLVEADEDHMRNVLMNLLDNANKYSHASPDITVFTINRGDRFIFGVQDKGMGMDTETQRKIFEKFFRVTTGNIHNIKGFGLGLSYVKAIVLAHKGDIQVKSEVGQGSRFEISLPVSVYTEPS